MPKEIKIDIPPYIRNDTNKIIIQKRKQIPNAKSNQTSNSITKINKNK